MRRGKEREDSEEIRALEERCAICLSEISNQTRISGCNHDQFCFNCISAWSNQSRRCPLCLGNIDKLIHNIRSDRDYQIYHLHPLSTTASSNSNSNFTSSTAYDAFGQSSHSRRSIDHREELNWREREEARALERRSYIYSQKLFAKHIASNPYTKFKPITPEMIASDPKLKARVLKFVRRELQTFSSIDIPFLTTYTLSIFSQMDIRSTPAIRLLCDFMDEDRAIHFAHEVFLFSRSGRETLEGFDAIVQYGRPNVTEKVANGNGGEDFRKREVKRERSRSPVRARSREASITVDARGPRSPRSPTGSIGASPRSVRSRSFSQSRENSVITAPPKSISIFGLAARVSISESVSEPVAVEPEIQVLVKVDSKLELNNRLQKRLLDEYRAAANAKSAPSLSLPSTLLQAKLQTKLKIEKAQLGRQEVIYSQELREMLLERLEEEKSLLEETINEDYEEDENETELRLLLERKKGQKQRDDEQEKREREKGMKERLKEKLLKERLMKR